MKSLALVAILILPACSINQAVEKANRILAIAEQGIQKGADYLAKGEKLLEQAKVQWDAVSAKIKAADTDGDGKLSLTEILAGIGTLGAGGLVLHRATTRGRHAANSSKNGAS